MPDDIKGVLESIQRTQDEFIKTHNEELEQLKKGSGVDFVTKDKFDKVNDELTELHEKLENLQTELAKANRPGAAGDSVNAEAVELRKNAIREFLRGGSMDGFKAAEREYREKAGTTTTNGWGSGLLEDVGRTIEDRLGKESDARQLVTVETRGSTDITDLLKTGAVGAAWRGEGGTVSESGQPSLVERKYSHGMIYALPKTTEESLDDLFFDVEAMLIDTAIEDFGEEESAVIFNGNGTNKPKGIFNETFSLTANTFGEIKYHASGIANAITDGTNGDIFIDMQADLHKRYEKSGKWIMHRKTLAEIRKMKNSNGDYIYQQALTDGTPQQILEREISLQEDMPLIGADAYPVAFGDMKKFYKLFPIVGLRLTRDETSDYGHVLYYIRRRLAGGVYDPRAVQFLKCEV